MTHVNTFLQTFNLTQILLNIIILYKLHSVHYAALDYHLFRNIKKIYQIPGGTLAGQGLLRSQCEKNVFNQSLRNPWKVASISLCTGDGRLQYSQRLLYLLLNLLSTSIISFINITFVFLTINS